MKLKNILITAFLRSELLPTWILMANTFLFQSTRHIYVLCGYSVEFPPFERHFFLFNISCNYSETPPMNNWACIFRIEICQPRLNRYFFKYFIGNNKYKFSFNIYIHCPINLWLWIFNEITCIIKNSQKQISRTNRMG